MDDEPGLAESLRTRLGYVVTAFLDAQGAREAALEKAVHAANVDRCPGPRLFASQKAST
ncbi:MAG TPA: hypothetical protein VNY30_17880 [Bryobacteraceae bacterium]|nr:hypothetical protein [Bryobacteraceae bacterium]